MDADPPAGGRRSRPLHRQAFALVRVAAGGIVGTAARYGLAQALPTESGRWPTGTFVANLLGSFVLGFLLEALLRAGPDTDWRQRTRLLVGTGFCGGFTTYSTLVVEADLLVRGHHAVLALAYVAATVLTGVALAVAGIAVAARVRSRPPT
ncbi:fluoride efflux transporter FluC [uncultured Jatrophihabitans sp.]|uniref:fluoride efflux transporter FluC n=1 Tax=uncultured Jatrophihabitans sp. TaxID=1610747 RepID=UPI0035CBC70C